MKTELNIEESDRLIELGVDAKLASKHTLCVHTPTENPNIYRKGEDSKPIFTLSDLLSILPKEIDDYCLNISYYMDEWYVCYEKIKVLGKHIILRTHTSPELIDALNSLLIWCLTEKKINLNTEKK